VWDSTPLIIKALYSTYVARRPTPRTSLRSVGSRPVVGGSHVRVLGDSQEIPTETVELSSGDVVGLGLTSPVDCTWSPGELTSFLRGVSTSARVLLSIDDVDRTLGTAAGEVGFPTISLTPAEARWLAAGLVSRAKAAER
jgi:hypothetical protein